MDNLRHIHDVLELLFTSEKQFTVASLQTELQNTYGEDVQFANCADHLFGIDEVVPFILGKNKIRLEGDTIIPLVPGCSH